MQQKVILAMNVFGFTSCLHCILDNPSSPTIGVILGAGGMLNFCIAIHLIFDN